MSLVPMRYSERLGLIEPEQLQEAAAQFSLGAVREAYVPAGGLFGQNIVLETAAGRFVLRGNPHGHDQLLKERKVAGFIHERCAIAAPWPYKICDDATIFGWTFAMMPLLPGTSGTDLWAMADDDARTRIAIACGDALADLHDGLAPCFGPYDAQMDEFIEMDDFADWFLYRLEHWRGRARTINALSTQAERYIDDLVDSCHDALHEPFEPVLVHHDFKAENLSFEATRDGFEATGVFDLFEAYLADGEEDLVRLLWHLETDDQRSAFLDAYTSAWPLRPGAEDRLSLYALADWLVIWEARRRLGRYAEDDETFVSTVTPIVDRVRRFALDLR